MMMPEECAKSIIDHVGKNIVIAVPLGLGKPIKLLNALFKMALNDSSLQLTIITGLTLSRPTLSNDLEKRFVEPILDRLLKDYEDPLYEKYRESQTLPKNINVIEFFLAPGKFLHNSYVQKHYVSSGYSTAVRDVFDMSVNVLAQLVSASDEYPNSYSLSCNTDLFHQLKELMRGKIAIVAEVNENLPYMLGDVAEVDKKIFSHVLDTKKYPALFAVPREKLTIQDHLIGLYASLLIRDNGCLQVGIGKLADALAYALILRHKNNKNYRELMQQLKINEKFGSLIADVGGVDIFSEGLYASTEMFSGEYMQLYKAGILKKKVYDHVGLQSLLNSNKIQEKITPNTIIHLLEHHIINENLTISDLKFLKHFGIFKEDVMWSEGQCISLDTIQSYLGDYLKSGKIMHAGFFLGSEDLYTDLRNLPHDELSLIEMTTITRTNSLLWAPELLSLQRQHARLVNSSLMVTLLGGIVSDGLENYKELSGVGGQYDFVSMASQLPGCRSIINCHSTRQGKQGIESNIIWEYSNVTIPRYLRDIIVTEYGMADCRGKTDEEVIKTLLNVADSRFQLDLMRKAKKFGKLSQDYQIPEIFRQNYPEKIPKIIHEYAVPYPFGSDLTEDEMVLAKALLYLKGLSKVRLVFTIIRGFFVNCDERYLKRMNLLKPRTLKEYLYRSSLRGAMTIA